MSEFFAKEFYGNSFTQWLVTMVIVVAAVAVGKVLYWLFSSVGRRLTAKTDTRLDDIILDMIEEPLVVIVTVFGFWAGFNTLTFDSEKVGSFIAAAMQAAITLSVAWLFARLVDSLIKEYLVPLAEKSKSDLDDHLLPIFRKGAKIGIWTLGIIVALNNAGYDVAALLAGLGVGGLALAIAAQDTVANIFGSVTIFADRPFALNDRIRINGHDGVVKEIGLRSTRLEARDGQMVSIPNSKFTGSAVENVTTGSGRRIVLNLGLTYDTTAEQMEKGIEILHEIAAANVGVGDDVKVSFSGYGDFAMIIRFAYFVNNDSHFRNTESAVNLEVLRRFGAEGLEFAYPTQTLYNIDAGSS